MRVALDCTSLAIQAGENILLWGDPGIGKSAAVAAIARGLGRACHVLSLAQCLPEDLGGIRFLDPATRRATICADEWCYALADAPGGGVLFLDEVNQASDPVQASSMPVIHDHRVQGVQLPATVSIAMAANPIEVATAGRDLAPALANRTCHLQIDGRDLSGYLTAKRTGEWYQPAVRLPADWRDRIGKWDGIVGSYIAARPSAVGEVPAEGSPARGCAWASRRTWDAAARWIAACEAAGIGIGDDATVAGVEGWIGPDSAGEFLGWLATLDLIDPEVALRDPAGVVLPTRGDRLAAALDAIVRAAIADHPQRAARYGAAWTILARVADAGTVDLGVPAGMALCQWRNKNAPQIPVPQSSAPYIALVNRIMNKGA